MDHNHLADSSLARVSMNGISEECTAGMGSNQIWMCAFHVSETQPMPNVQAYASVTRPHCSAFLP